MFVHTYMYIMSEVHHKCMYLHDMYVIYIMCLDVEKIWTSITWKYDKYYTDIKVCIHTTHKKSVNKKMRNQFHFVTCLKSAKLHDDIINSWCIQHYHMLQTHVCTFITCHESSKFDAWHIIIVHTYVYVFNFEYLSHV